MIGARYTAWGAGTETGLGTWYRLASIDGGTYAGLQLEGLALRDVDVARRVVDLIQAQIVAQVSGLVKVVDLLFDGRDAWVVAAATPAPSIAQIVRSGQKLPAEVAVAVAIDTAKTLQRLHMTQESHGDVGTHTSVLNSHGRVLLSEGGLAQALAGTRPSPAQDSRGWATMLGDLADSCIDSAVADILRLAESQARSASPRAAIDAGLRTLYRHRRRTARFSDRAEVREFAVSTQTVSSTPVARGRGELPAGAARIRQLHEVRQIGSRAGSAIATASRQELREPAMEKPPTVLVSRVFAVPAGSYQSVPRRLWIRLSGVPSAVGRTLTAYAAHRWDLRPNARS